MKKIETVFLAGPDAWSPDAAEGLAVREEVCQAMGFRGVSPKLGAGLEEEQRSEVTGRRLYADALALLRSADALVANLTPWRGPNCDPATAYLMGFASALNKPVAAYLNVADEEEADLRSRVEAWYGAGPDATGRWRDGQDCEVEDFYLPENLLLWAEARRFYVIVTPNPMSDVQGLHLCLEALKLYSE